MNQIKWVYKYKAKISVILIIALIISPFVYLPKQNTVKAQSSGIMSSIFTNDKSNFSGISQWGNSQFINNPDMAKALNSCTNVVPSFQKKIKGLFHKKKKIASGINTDLPQVKLGKKMGGMDWGCGFSGTEKLAAGTPSGYSKYDIANNLVSQEQADSCDTSKIKEDEAKALAVNQPIEVIDKETNKKASDILILSKSTNDAVTATKEVVEGEKVRNECMDSIAYALSRQALAGLTESTVNWIETGNWDDPYYLKEPAQFFNNLKSQTLKQTLGNLYDNSIDGLAQIGENTDYPFLRTTYKGLLAKYSDQDFKQASKSTLADILIRVNGNNLSNMLINNNNNKSQAVNDFRNDFSKGGWAGWLALTQNPANNPAGFAIMANDEINKKVTTKEKEINRQLDNGDGFLSQTRCIEENVPEFCSEYTDLANTVYKYDDPRLETISKTFITCTKSIPAHKNTRGVKSKPTDATCTKTKVVTPGSIIAERMKFVATTDVRQLELADQFNESLGAVFTAAFNRLQSEGLSSLSKDKYGDWASQANKQSFLQTYNSLYQTKGSPVKTESAQLILRREATGYSSSDFDITTDLDDYQIGCTTNPGILTTQKNYLKELKESSKPNGALLRVIPAIAELDYCIPGPTNDWETLADESFAGLYNTLVENSIPYIRKAENPEFSTYYSSIGKKLQELNLKAERADNFEKNASTTNYVVGGLVTVAAAICTSTCWTGFGAIVAGIVLLTAGVATLIAKQKAKNAKEEDTKLRNATGDFIGVADNMFAREAREWTDQQIGNLIQDYNLYKYELYDKFSNENSIPVAEKARPFVNSVVAYAQKTRSLLTDYQKEIKEAENDLEELIKIKSEVDKIKSSAIARAKAEEIAKGLKPGTLTDVDPTCKPAKIQCPNTNTTPQDKIVPTTDLYNLISGSVGGQGVAGLNKFSDSVAQSQDNANINSGIQSGLALAPEPEILSIKPVAKSTGGSSVYSFLTVFMSVEVSDLTLSVLMTCSNPRGVEGSYNLSTNNTFLLNNIEVFNQPPMLLNKPPVLFANVTTEPGLEDTECSFTASGVVDGAGTVKSNTKTCKIGKNPNITTFENRYICK